VRNVRYPAPPIDRSVRLPKDSSRKPGGPRGRWCGFGWAVSASVKPRLVSFTTVGFAVRGVGAARLRARGWVCGLRLRPVGMSLVRPDRAAVCVGRSRWVRVAFGHPCRMLGSASYRCPVGAKKAPISPVGFSSPLALVVARVRHRSSRRVAPGILKRRDGRGICLCR
jgi:hypothetical protein